MGFSPSKAVQPGWGEPLGSMRDDDARWERRFRELVGFRRRRGHFVVPHRGPAAALACWVNNQRQRFRRGRLASERVRRLRSVGFPFHMSLRAALATANQPGWDENFRALAAFHREHGHFVVPQRAATRPLSQWMSVQRMRFRQGRLAANRLERLQSIGFPLKLLLWEAAAISKTPAWERRFRALLAFRREHGHLFVPTPRDSRHSGLAMWMEQQRAVRRAGRFLPNRERRLREIGFEFNPTRSVALLARSAGTWERHLAALAAFKRKHGRCDAPWQGDKRLSIWTSNQRKLWRKRKLPPARERRLRALGFSFEDPARGVQKEWDERWTLRLRDLVAFRREHGHFVIPGHGRIRTLAQWAQAQRVRFRRGRLQAKRVQLLRAAGFPFDLDPTAARAVLSREKWERWFGQLVTFQRTFGHCRVSRDSAGPAGLAGWVFRQRRRRRKGTLLQEQEERLRRLGFDFEPLRSPPRPAQEDHLEAIREFRRRYGHLAVPDVAPHRALHAWLRTQRLNLRRGTLLGEIRSDLEGLGVPLTTEELVWENWFVLLVDFRRRRGHLRVGEHGALARWFELQRLLLAAGELPLDREKRLDRLGLRP